MITLTDAVLLVAMEPPHGDSHGDPHAEVLKEMYDRSKRIIWLNPEARLSWNTGDSEMRRYSAYCHQVEECNSLMHLERVVGNLLKQVN